MSEAYKCEVLDCDRFFEGSPRGFVTIDGVKKAMCPDHTESLETSFFPKKEPEAPAGTPPAGTPAA